MKNVISIFFGRIRTDHKRLRIVDDLILFITAIPHMTFKDVASSALHSLLTVFVRVGDIRKVALSTNHIIRLVKRSLGD